MSLGAEIRKQRALRQWTLEDLSERSGVDVGTISALEIRNSTRSKFAVAIAGAFGITLDQLLNPVQTTNSAYQPTPSERPNDDAVVWPFKRVSYRRYKYLMDTMPPAMRDRAFTDIDSHFEILLEKWERSFRNHQERKAA